MSDSAPPPSERPEQREHPRFRVEGATAVLGTGGFLESLGLPIRNAVINLSQGGVLVLAPKRFAPETRLHVRIEVANPPDVVEAEGSIRWCAQSARNDAQYYVGIHFEEPDPLMQKKIAQMREWSTSAEHRSKRAAR